MQGLDAAEPTGRDPLNPPLQCCFGTPSSAGLRNSNTKEGGSGGGGGRNTSSPVRRHALCHYGAAAFLPWRPILKRGDMGRPHGVGKSPEGVGRSAEECDGMGRRREECRGVPWSGGRLEEEWRRVPRSAMEWAGLRRSGEDKLVDVVRFYFPCTVPASLCPRNTRYPWYAWRSGEMRDGGRSDPPCRARHRAGAA